MDRNTADEVNVNESSSGETNKRQAKGPKGNGSLWPLAVVGVLFVGLCLVACEKNPIDELSDPVPGGALPQSSGVFVIFDDELKTGGGVGLMPSGENQSLRTDDTSSPRRTPRSIAYQWNGGDVPDETGTPQHLFAGFFLPQTLLVSEMDGSPGRNLTTAQPEDQYTSLKFFIRGALSVGNRLQIKGPDDGSSGVAPLQIEFTAATLPSSWQEVVISGIPASHFMNIRSFLTLAIIYDQPPRTTTPGEGGIIYLDDIRYEK